MMDIILFGRRRVLFGLPLVGVNQESGVGFPNLNKIADAYEMPYYRLATTEKMDAALKEILGMTALRFVKCCLIRNKHLNPNYLPGSLKMEQ